MPSCLRVFVPEAFASHCRLLLCPSPTSMTAAGRVQPIVPPCWQGQGCPAADQRAVQSWCWLPGRLKAVRAIRMPPHGSSGPLWQATPPCSSSWSSANASSWAAHLLPALWHLKPDHPPSCVHSCQAQRFHLKCSTAQCPAHARCTSGRQLSTDINSVQQRLTASVSTAIRRRSLTSRHALSSLALLSGL